MAEQSPSWIADLGADMLGRLGSIEAGSFSALLISATAAVIWQLVKSVWQQSRNYLQYRMKKEKAILDLLIYMKFFNDSFKKVCSPSEIGRLKGLIDKNPDIKFYTEIVKEEYIFDEFKKYRHDLRTADMVLADRFISQARLFERYYSKLATDEFKSLSPERKHAVLDSLANEGREAIKMAKLCRASNYFSELAYNANLK